VRVDKAGSKPAAKGGRKSAKAKSGATRAVKYRDEAGRTWGGIGKRRSGCATHSPQARRCRTSRFSEEAPPGEPVLSSGSARR